KTAQKSTERFVRQLKRFRKDDRIRVLTLGWIENMAEVLAASDIVFGKAGPNFLFDCVACRKPFVAITHIGGQEDGNLELILAKQLGWVREKRREIVRFLKDYLENPEYYEQIYAENIEKEALINQRSAELIAERIRNFEPQEERLRTRAHTKKFINHLMKKKSSDSSEPLSVFRLKPKSKLKPKPKSDRNS
ncbi:MAG: hypothetical protein GX749_02790, partial [Ruminococcaceae bacterium]|nr:hypothetical protein [Oscillospiraceae bacterium]